MALYLTEDDVARVLDVPLAIDCVERAHGALARGEAMDVPRQRARGAAATLHLLQASWPASGAIGYKAYTSTAQGARFLLHLFDCVSGAPLAVIEANRLGMLRTGAVGAVAAKHLARESSREVGIIGAGWQAEGQMRALMQVRPIERFKVFARDRERLAQFCARMAGELDCEVVTADSAPAAVEGVDIVVTITTSPKPVLEGAWLTPGMHINAAGSNSLARRELDEAAVLKADLVCVDSIDTALKEAGDLQGPIEKGRLLAGRLLELGDIVAGFRAARRDSAQITLFESQGMAIQDLAVGVEVLHRARAMGLGHTLPY